MGDDRKADYEMAPTEDPENPASPPEKADLQNQDAQDSNDQEWSGLGKEELLRVADTPAWNWTRNILLVLFWIAWILMLIVAIILVVKAPSCPETEWYEKSSIYQVFVPSFKDGDNDGIGDLIGLAGQVNKIKEEFGAETILLSPIFEQASNDDPFNFAGRETVDFKAIDPIFGSVVDFKKIIDEVQVNGMHIVIEFVPNQSSDKHPWFVDSSKDRDNEYADYYTWANGSGSDPPNDWENYMGAPAWKYVAARDQWYYHFYESEQPDLNFKNEEVVAAIKDAMTYWLDEMNVDGFVLVDADRLVEDVITTSVAGRKRRQVTDTAASSEPPAASAEPTTLIELETTAEPTAEPNPPGMTDSDGGEPMPSPTAEHVQYDVMSSESLSADLETLLEELYTVLEDNSYLGKFRVFIPQHSGPLEQNVFFQREEWRGFASSLQFANSLGDKVNGFTIYSQLEALQDAKANDGKSDLWNSWMLGHAGISRFATRAGDNARALLMLLYTLPGTPMPFYGDELGLMDNSGGGDYAQLTPYPYDGSATGGFGSSNSSVEPWAPYADDIGQVNAETQSKTDNSFLKYYQSLTKIHKEPSILAGATNLTTISGDVLAYTRAFPEWAQYLVVVNLGAAEKSDYMAYETEMKGKLVLSASGFTSDEVIKPDNMDIGANDAYLIELMN